MKELLHRLRRHSAYWYTVWVLTVAVAVVFTLQLGRLWWVYEYGSPGTNDFIEYWTAGQLLRGGGNPYDFKQLYELQKGLGSPHDFPIIMWNPPWLLVWIFPLLLLPFFTAALVWVLLNGCLIFFVSSRLIWRIVAPPARPAAIASVATLAFIPALLTLRMGQMSSIILVGVAGFLYFGCRGRDFLAGVCLALTTTKPHVVYLLWIVVAWWVLTEKRWRVVAGVVALLAPTFTLLTLLWPGWLPAYRAALAEPPLYWATTTLGGILRKVIFAESPEAQFLPPLLGALGVFAYLLFKRPAIDWKTCAGPLLLLSVPTAAYGWAFDQVVLLVPYLEIVGWLTLVPRHSTPHLGSEERGRVEGTGAEMWSRLRKGVVVSGLLLIAVGMVAQNLLEIPEVFFFWVPLALGGVYVWARLARHSVSPLALTPQGVAAGGG